MSPTSYLTAPPRVASLNLALAGGSSTTGATVDGALRTALRSRLALALPVMAAVVLLAGCGSSDSKKQASAKKHGSVELLYVANGKSGTVTPSGGKDRYKLT